MRKIFLPTLLFVTLACVARPDHRVTKANFERIEIGMSYEQVAEIFGDPGVEWTGHGEFTFDRKWTGPDGSIAGAAFLNGLVTEKTWIPSSEPKKAKEKNGKKERAEKGERVE